LSRYTLLQPGDLPRYLGCDLVRNDAPSGLVLLGIRQLPRPLSELASREQLFIWLSRVLIYTVIPGHGGSSREFRVRLPNNLVAFIDLLIYLHGVGFPGHWLSEFLQSILNNNLITDITPYVGQWPIPVSDVNRRVLRRKVNLDPWLVEMESILAVVHTGLPFVVPLPDYSDADITTFESAFSFGTFSRDTRFHEVSMENECVSLLFYKESPIASPLDLVCMLPAHLNGQRRIPSGDVFILTSQEFIDVTGLSVRWKLSKKRFGTMQRDPGWKMVIFRTDIQEPCESPYCLMRIYSLMIILVTNPIPLSRWRIVDAVLDPESVTRISLTS
jgi:hypothetical protein